MKNFWVCVSAGTVRTALTLRSRRIFAPRLRSDEIVNMEAVFILTYLGVIIAATALACLGYWISERVKGRGGWKQVKRWAAMAWNVILQVALLWFAGLGIAFSLLMLYWVFVRPVELGIQAAVITYVIGIISAIGMWTAVWRREVDNGLQT